MDIRGRTNGILSNHSSGTLNGNGDTSGGVTRNTRVESNRMRFFSRLHSFRGKISLFGHFFHAQYILLGLVEFVTFMCVPMYVIPLFDGGVAEQVFNDPTWSTSAFFSLVLIFYIVSMGLYDTRQRIGFFRVVLPRLIVAFTAAALTILIMMSVFFQDSFNTTRLAQFIVISLIYSTVLRIYFEKLVDGNILKRRILVVGAGEKAAFFEKLRRKTDKRGFDLVGYISINSSEPVHVSTSKVISLDGNICTYALINRIDEIVIALDDRRLMLPLDDLLDCRMSGVNVIEMQDFFERETEKIHLKLLQPSWLIYAKGFRRNILRSIIKRTFDVVVSSLLLFITLPIVAVVIIAIYIESNGKGPILYHQTRVGRGGSHFDLIKFRSMFVNAEEDGIARWAKENDPRVTPVGAFLRKYRLDEIPQLWNVLTGDMSIVGPRPERPEFVEKLCALNSFYAERHRVKPGVAGWAQESYPYGASEKDSIQKLQYDLYYVKNHGILFDIYVLVQTVEVILFSKGSR